jgi:hypothetical protein
MLLIKKGRRPRAICRECKALHSKSLCPKRRRGVDPWTRRRFDELMALKAALASVDDVRKLAV